MLKNKKSLGQHWLKDRYILGSIADDAEITSEDFVLEIGPGLGTLTSELLKRAKEVLSIELDKDLARKLPGQFPGKKLTVLNQDFLDFDLNTLPTGYKVVANVPYYITAKIVNRLMTSENRPSTCVLLVQKEVAERLAAKKGDMSILAISAQIFAEVTLGEFVPAEYFTPPPKVDSQVVILKTFDKPLLGGVDEKKFFRVVKAGFASPRKKLRSSLSGGLGIEKEEASALLISAGIDSNKRPQDISIDEWLKLTSVVVSKSLC